jgi:hypothetical protein
MKKLSKIIENANWIIASPTSESVGTKAEFFVSRKAVRRVSNIIRTYVLINYDLQQSLIDKRGKNQTYRSTIYRKDLSEKTGLSKISAIAFFTESFAKGYKSLSFFYHEQPWEYDQSGIAVPLIQFMLNHAPTNKKN